MRRLILSPITAATFLLCALSTFHGRAEEPQENAGTLTPSEIATAMQALANSESAKYFSSVHRLPLNQAATQAPDVYCAYVKWNGRNRQGIFTGEFVLSSSLTPGGNPYGAGAGSTINHSLTSNNGNNYRITVLAVKPLEALIAFNRVP